MKTHKFQWRLSAVTLVVALFSSALQSSTFNVNAADKVSSTTTANPTPASNPIQILNLFSTDFKSNIDLAFIRLCGMKCRPSSRAISVKADSKFSLVDLTYNLDVVDYLRIYIAQMNQGGITRINLSAENPFCYEFDKSIMYHLLAGYRMAQGLPLPSRGIVIHINKFVFKQNKDKYGNKLPDKKMSFAGSQMGISSLDLKKINWNSTVGVDLAALSTLVPFRLSKVSTCVEDDSVDIHYF